MVRLGGIDRTPSIHSADPRMCGDPYTEHDSVRQRLLPIAIGIAVAIALGGPAYAAFSARGQGTDTAASSTLLAVTVAALTGGDAPSTTLQPGGQADVVLRVSNPNSFAVTLVSVTPNGTVTASGGSGTCTSTGVTFAGVSGLSTTIAAAGTTLVHLASAANMSTSSTTGCQGATFSIPVSITVRAT